MKKPLPKLRLPEYELTLPLSQEKVRFRPFNVSDERVLMQAAASKDSDKAFYINNTVNVIRNSIVSDDTVVDRVPSIDIDFLLLHQRAKSVGEEIEFSYDKKPTSANINSFVLVNPREESGNKIDIGGGIFLQMKDPTFADGVDAAVTSENNVDVFYKLIMLSIASVYNEEEVWIVGQDISIEEVEEFIKDIPSTESRKLYDYVMNGPYLAVKVMIDGEEVELSSKEVDFLV